MFRIAASPQDLATAIRVLRPHSNLSIAELQKRLRSAQPIAEFDLIDLTDIRRCRALLRDLEQLGISIRVFEDVEGFGEREESLEYLKSAMRRSVQIGRQIREQDDLRSRSSEVD